jgi:hypothetical protein
MTDSIKHYEQVWNEAEEIASKKFSSETTEYIVNTIKAELDTILLYDTKTELSSDTRRLLKHRSLGAILFLLCAISHRENINTWAALNEEKSFEETDISELKKMLEQQI